MPQDAELNRVVFEGDSVEGLATKARQFVKENNLPRERIFGYIENPQPYGARNESGPSYTLIYR